MVIETHPLEPFLPGNARILFLGSFPPPKARWSMEFFYPNGQNDFWRIMGLIHFGNPGHFEVPGAPRRFDKDRIVDFCEGEGLAFFDTARKVCRLKGNASDEFLEILEPTDVGALLEKTPSCRTVVTTGGKSSEELLSILQADGAGLNKIPAVGESVEVNAFGKSLRWWRMPSTSRAYPMSLARKAERYSVLFSK